MSNGSEDPSVVWLAQGLSREPTGIENFVLTLAENLQANGVLDPSRLTVLVDADNLWSRELAESGAHIVSDGRLARTRADSAAVTHVFGRNIVPSHGRTLFSIYDWGPFFDRDMAIKTRLAWAPPMAYNHARAETVHYLNRNLALERPRWLKAARNALVCYPGLRTTTQRPLLPAGNPTFIGTDTPRKRLDSLTHCADAAGVRLTLAGSGTERYAGRRVDALGRVDEDRLDQLLGSASCLILVSEYEGFGIPILEAADLGIYSVVSRAVFRNLPDDLRGFCVAIDELDPVAFRLAVDEAESRRGSPFRGNLLTPLLEYYSHNLTS